MKKIDMHIHTCASDGTWDAEELKEELKKSNINIFSITDHDRVDNIKNMEDILMPQDNILFIPGTELSAEYEGKEYHLTLYNYDIKNNDLIKLINWTTENKLGANSKYIENYASDKYENVSINDYENYEYDRKKGGWKSANYMIDKGIHKNIPEHLADMNKSGFKAQLKAPEEVINIAKKSGGKIFLAHPSYHYKNSVMPVDELKFWIEAGVEGIECFSPYNGESTEHYISFCKKNNLMISGGSDCHGSFIPARKLGEPDILLHYLNIKKLLE